MPNGKRFETLNIKAEVKRRFMERKPYGISVTNYLIKLLDLHDELLERNKEGSNGI